MFLRENEQELSYLMSYRSSFIISLPPPAAVPVAAGAVQQLMAGVQCHSRVHATAVEGLSLRHYTTLQRSPFDRVNLTTLIDACDDAGISLPTVSMGSGQKTIVRGVCTGNYLPPAVRVTDTDEEYHYPNHAQRLRHITWTATSQLSLSRCLLSVRHICHWLPCSCEKRMRYIVYKVFDLGLRPLPPAPLSKFLGFRPLPPVSF